MTTKARHVRQIVTAHRQRKGGLGRPPTGPADRSSPYSGDPSLAGPIIDLVCHVQIPVSGNFGGNGGGVDMLLRLRACILVEQDEPRKVCRTEEGTERAGETVLGGFEVHDARVA